MSSYKFIYKPFSISIKDIQEPLKQTIYEELSRVNSEIDRNRQKGIAADKSAFHPYSEGYRKRIEAGKVKFKGSTTVNLTQTGQFVRSIVVEKLTDGAAISVHSQDSRDKYQWLTDKGYNPILYLTDLELNKIKKTLENKIQSLLSKLVKS